jgi:hypothetical protein
MDCREVANSCQLILSLLPCIVQYEGIIRADAENHEDGK